MSNSHLTFTDGAILGAALALLFCAPNVLQVIGGMLP